MAVAPANDFMESTAISHTVKIAFILRKASLKDEIILHNAPSVTLPSCKTNKHAWDKKVNAEIAHEKTKIFYSDFIVP